ncbi:MAG: SBBP repeat-containing protein [Ignavibacteria bacterium]|nr:SBBP repeat-containing protein [Ignavibacteria bacterium]
MKTSLQLTATIIYLFLATTSFSQVIQQWASVYHFASEDAKALAVDSSGNVYVTGSSSGDCATVKYNSSGIQQWASRFNGTGNSTDYSNAIAIDAEGNVYIAGGSIGIGSNSDYVTIKYNSSGILQWAARYDGAAHSLDEAFSIDLDDSGNVYVTGGSITSTLTNDYVTIKYNSAGILQWLKTYNGTGNNVDIASSIALDSSGNTYVTGTSRGSGTSDDNFATIKYSPSGFEMWVRTYNGPGDGFDQSRKIAVDKSGNSHITGRSFGDGTQYDYATIKYNTLGDSLWVKRFNGLENSSDYSTTLAIDKSGNTYVSGQSFGSISNYDYVTIKYDPSGTEQWARIFNGPGNSVDNSNAIAVDNLGNVYVTGSSFLSGSSYNYATVRYSNAGVEDWSRSYNGTANGSDESFAVVADANGNVYVTGGSAGSGQFKDFVTIKYSPGYQATIRIFAEGLYNSSLDKMLSDTAWIFIRNATYPYDIVDSSRSIIDSSGYATFDFANVINATNYFILLKHRNSIETWSSTGNVFLSGLMSYDFSTDANKAYGNNLSLVDNSPVRFAMFSGDVNQDGTVDASDLSLIDNDAVNFVTGYVSTDLNGDNFVDATDFSLADNNAINFVGVIRP